MKRHIIFTLSFILWVTLCHAFDPHINQWNDFEGKLGKADIQMSLYFFEDGQIKGNYCYKRYGTKIQLEGQIKDSLIELTEFIKGRTNGFIKGKLFTDSLDKFEANWTDSSKTKMHDLKLTLSSICSGTYDHRYGDLFGTDEELETFVKHIKSSIQNNDKEWIANHSQYPITTSLNNKKSIVIKNKKQLIDNFDQIFYQEFKDIIKQSCTCNLFHNYEGAMLGSGQIWINNKSGSTNNNYEYCIIAINNY